MADRDNDIAQLRERIGKLEEQIRVAVSDAGMSRENAVRNEARLKSIQHRVDEAEKREEASIRDIHEIRLSLIRQDTRIKAVASLLKIFGSIVTALSILIQIGRAILL